MKTNLSLLIAQEKLNNFQNRYTIVGINPFIKKRRHKFLPLNSQFQENVYKYAL